MLLGLLLLVAVKSGDILADVIGGFLALAGLGFLVINLRYRVWIDYPYVIVRQPWGRYRSIRLDQLIGAYFSGATGPGTARNLVLRDDGGELLIPPLLFRINRLYGALGASVDPNRLFVDDELCRLIRRHSTDPHWH